MPFGLSNARSEVFVPDGIGTAQALSRTTHLGIGAHPDDLEIMAIHGIVECFDSDNAWFTGVVATDGAGGAFQVDRWGRSDADRWGPGPTDYETTPGRSTPNTEELVATRRAEQRRAAELGRYGALVLLNHSSAEVKDPARTAVVDDLVAVLRATSPGVIYTHNLADAHDTHVAISLAVLAACRALDPAERPQRVIGCEVWRDLDWLPPDAKVAMPLGNHEALEMALIRVFESQLDAGKRFDLGTLGRRRANATFDEIRHADRHERIVWGMDLTRAAHGEVEPSELVASHVRALENDIADRLRRFAR